MDRRPERIRFEGIILSIDGAEVQVEIEGIGPALVFMGRDTKIHGVLEVGAVVRLLGSFNNDLSVSASEIDVKQLLEAVPYQLAMGFNDTQTVQAILSRTFDDDVEVTLISLDSGIAQPSVPTLSIPAGAISGSFEVTSASIEGRTFIEAELPSSLGGQTAVVEVEVEARQKTQLEIKWFPDELKLSRNEARTVKIVLNRPVPFALSVDLVLREGLPGLVEFLPQVNFPDEYRVIQTTIKSGSTSGKAKIRVSFPPIAGSDHDDLEIEVE